MENLHIQVGVMETIILFIKTTTKGSENLLQVAKLWVWQWRRQDLLRGGAKIEKFYD